MAMHGPDLLNGIFEFGLSIFLLKGVLKLRVDKEVTGFYWPTVLWTTAWGLWNLFYYPHLDQWASFWGGVFVVSANIAWLAHVGYYSSRFNTAVARLFSAAYRRDRQKRNCAHLAPMQRILSAAGPVFPCARK